MWHLIIVTLLLAKVALSEGFSNFQCARYCKEDTNNLGYENNKIYLYHYYGSAKSLVNNTSNFHDHHLADQSGIKINSIVAFQPLSNCDYVMEILDVTITDYHIKSTKTIKSDALKFQTLQEQLIAFPLHFSFKGKIDTICPDASETKEVLDIKRGILSAFQNSNSFFKENALVYETDITGNCETHYSVRSGRDGVKKVNKTKNLNACDHRMSNYFSWQTVPMATTRTLKSLPLLKSTLNCDLKYGPGNKTGNILLESKCYEKHVFQPFSNGDNGALTYIEQQMKFFKAEARKKQYAAPNNVTRSTLIYEYKYDIDVEHDPKVAMEILKELEEKTVDGVDMNVPGMFSKLVYEFQRLKKKDLMEIFKQITLKQRSFYIDAISLVTTNSGIEVMSDLYANKKVNDKQMNAWLVSINFIKSPNKQSIKLIHPLTFHSKIKQNAMLSLSNVLYKYCSKQHCLEDTVILEIIKSIEKAISNNCIITSENDNRDIFLALKSIGNAGLTSNYYHLQNCYINTELPIEVRLAAIAAHRRIKCAENENLDDFKRILANTRANSEVRIAAYIATMQCASYASFAQVKDVLLREEANQVGAFIWTHLTNLQETSIPWKQGIRKLLENEFLQNKFNTDLRRYSRNYEASTFFDSVGAGGGVEANVIFSAESYLPRSAMLNFTLDLFGETINVLELGIRLEGFEDVVEDLFSGMRKGDEELVVRNQTGSYKQERIDEFGEIFKVLPKQPSGIGYIKIFGNEISYTNFACLKDLLGVPLSSKAALDMLIQFIKLEEIEYTRSFLLFDSNYKIPTLLGFPLQLKSNATATVGFSAGGEVNTKDLRNQEMLIKGKFYPSLSVQVASTMGMDTYVGEIGVQYLGALKSNMYIDGYANVEMGRLVDVKINVPKKQMDIFTVFSDLYLVYNEESILMQDASKVVENSEYCTDGNMAKIIGLQFCNQWRFVNASSASTPNFPLTGSFKYSMHIKKTDAFDFYQLYLETKLTDPKGQYLIDFLLDSPNSMVDRKLQCTLSVDFQDYKVDVVMHSPFTNFQLHSHIEKELLKYKFQLMTRFNNKEVLALMSTFDVKDEGEIITYEPLAKLNYRHQQIIALTGKLSKIKGGEYSADLKLQGISNEVAQIYGNFSCGTGALTIKTNIMSTHFKGNLEAGLYVRAHDVEARADLSYNYNSMIQEHLKFFGMLNQTQSETLNKNLFLLDLTLTEWPIYDTHLRWENQRGHLYFNNTGEAMFWETTWRTHQIVKLANGFTSAEPDMLLVADLQSPQNNVDYQAKLQFSKSSDHFKTHFLFQLNRIIRTEALVDYKSTHGKDSLNILLYHLKKSWSLNGVLSKHPSRNYNFDVECSYNTLDKTHVLMTLKGDYKNISHGEMQTHRLNCTLDLPETNGEWRTPWIITSTVQKSHTTFLSLSKVTTREADYAGHFNWIEDSLSLVIQTNDKQLFALNAARSEEEIVNMIVALNIHQHFEFRAKLIPYKKFDLGVYWDKDKDDSQRFLFSVGHNQFKGQFNMEIEYPNQKISTNILLVPSQVIINVTWGIEISKKIYLKLGNKHYIDGGIWFGELETPFRYLEKQQFHLQFAFVSDSFDVQSDLSWRNHQINLLITASKSNTHLNATLQLNTTLPEIKRTAFTLSHVHIIDSFDLPSTDQEGSNLNYQSNAAFDYNDHSIRAESHWLMRGDRVDSNFRIDSPSATIDPIYGLLNLNDNIDQDDTSNMNFLLSWHHKNITAAYNFKRDISTIEVVTPFQGIERTLLKYSVVTQTDSVYLSTTVDIFKHNNSITLSWTNTDDVTSFWLDLMSPMTGGYYVFFTHSVLLGKLNENFQIRGPDSKDLLQMKVEGNIMPLLKMNVTASMALMEHDIMLTVINRKEPLLSNIIAKWNDKSINSKLQLKFEERELRLINWFVESNLFAPVNISYEKDAKQSVARFILPNDFELVNKYVHSNPYFTNGFSLKAPELIVEMDYKSTKSTVNQKMIAELGEKKVEYISSYSARFDEEKKVDLIGSYNFYQNHNLVHSYNLSTHLKQSTKNEQLVLTLQSVTSLNGKFHLERKISSQIAGNSLGMTCKFSTYCDLEAVADDRHVLWKNNLSGKHLNLTYNVTHESLTANLITNMDTIPSSSLNLQHHDSKLQLDAKMNKYNLKLDTDLKNHNSKITIKNYKAIIGLFTVQIPNARQLNVTLNMNQPVSYKASFSYNISPQYLELLAIFDMFGIRAGMVSKFDNDQGLINGLVNMTFNQQAYSSTVKLFEKQLDLTLKTPDDQYIGRMHHSFNILHNLDVELSNRNSKNYIKFSKFLNNLHMTLVSNYLEIPRQEIQYSWESLMNFTGEGFYIKEGGSKQKFTVRSGSFKDWSLAYYKPNGDLLFNLNVHGRFESERDFDAVVDGTWDGHRIKLDVKNYFGSYYQTTFNLVTPIKGWARTSFDCTLNEQKIEIAMQGKGRYTSLLAGKNGDDMLRIEYMGETLLEMSSSEGHLTLRTTSYLGKYRLFVQITHTPGIYVFSILKGGENLVSFMLQNYSINDVLHYKGKLMAPEIIPNNSTLSVEFQADLKIWKYFDFKMKKDHKQLMQLSWENSRHQNGADLLLKFNSQIDNWLNFKLQPSFSIRDGDNLEADIAISYPCEKHTECSFTFASTQNRVVCNSLSSLDMLNFHIQSNFILENGTINADFEFNDFKYTNIGMNLSAKSLSYFRIDGTANWKDQFAIASINLAPNSIQMKVATTQKHSEYYFLMKTLVIDDHILLDLHLPSNEYFKTQNITIKGSISLKKGLLTVAKNRCSYEINWQSIITEPRMSLSASIKENSIELGNFTFTNTQIKGYTYKTDTKLFLNFLGDIFDVDFNALLSNSSANCNFVLQTPWEAIRTFKSGLMIAYTTYQVTLKQFLQVNEKDEYKLTANGLSTEKGMVLTLSCLPFGHQESLVNQTITTQIKYEFVGKEKKKIYTFDVDLGRKHKYHVIATPGIDKYSIEVEHGSNKIAKLIVTPNSVDFTLGKVDFMREIMLQIDTDNILLASSMLIKGKPFKEVFFVQKQAFGFLLETHTQNITLLYKTTRDLPTPTSWDPFISVPNARKLKMIILADVLHYKVIVADDQQPTRNINFELKLREDFHLDTAFISNDLFYKISVNFQGQSKDLIIYKTFKKVENQIYIPFKINFDNDPNLFLTLTSNNCSISLQQRHQFIQVQVGDNHLKFQFDYFDGILIHFERDTHQMYFELIPVGLGQKLEFTLNNGQLYSLLYDLQSGLVIRFKQIVQGNLVVCNLDANSVHDITFEILTNRDRSILWKSYIDDSSISYQLMVPKWTLLRVFDFAVTWENNSEEKVFGVALKVDSDYTGLAEAGTVYEQREFLLNIESFFKVLFLQGLETFYAKVYIPQDFRPHIEFVLPGQTYRFYYNHWDNFVETEIICRNEHFYLMLNNTSMNNLTVHVEFPDERFKSLLFKHSNYGLLQLKINEEYSLNAKSDLTYIDVRTPFLGYEKFGYLCEKSYDHQHGAFKLVIVHPKYEEPLGVAFKLNFENITVIDLIYTVHSPFAIGGFDFILANVTSRLDTGRAYTRLNLGTNGLDVGGYLEYVVSDQRKYLKIEAHHNNEIHIAAFNWISNEIFLILANPQKKERNFMDTFPELDRYIEGVQMIYLGISDDQFNLLVHLAQQPFSLRRNGNTDIKLIWDLHKPSETNLGGKYIPGRSVEIYLADNRLVAKNDNNGNLYLGWNYHNLEYSSSYANVSISNREYNVTSVRRLQTPFGYINLSQVTSTKRSKLSNKYEVDWRGRNSTVSKLSIGYDITSGRLTSTLDGSMLNHPLILDVDMSEFRSIPSKFDAVLIYSNETEKIITFSMRYNKSNEVINHMESVYTDRIFVLKHPSSKVDYELYFNAIRMNDFSNGSVTLCYKDFNTNKSETIHGSVKVDHSKFGVHAEMATSRNKFNLVTTSTTGVKRHGFVVHLEINDKDPLNMECNYNFQKYNPSVSLMAAYGTSRKYLFYAGMPNEKEITAKLGHESYGRVSLDAMAIVKLNTSQLLWTKVLWKDYLYTPFQEAILDEYNDLRYVIEAMGKELIDAVHDDVGREFITDCTDIKNRITNQTILDLQKTFKQIKKQSIQFDQVGKIQEHWRFFNENLNFFYDITEHTIVSIYKSGRILLNALSVEVDRALKDIKNIQHFKVDAKNILKSGIETTRMSLKNMERIIVRQLDDFDQYIEGIKKQIEDFFEPFLSLVDDFIVYIEQRLTMLQLVVIDAMDSIQQYVYNLREVKAMFAVYHSYINWLEELHFIKMLDPVTDVIEEILETIISDIKRVLNHYKPYLDALGDALFGKYDGIQQLPPIVEVREHVNRIYHKTIWVWNYHNMTQGLKKCIQKFSKDVDNMLFLAEFDDFPASDEDLEYLFGYNYVFKPENRLIEISQPLPVEWEAFNKSPSFANYPLYKKIQGKSEQFIKFYKSRYDLINMLESFVADLYEPSISPITLNYAMLIGKTQYTTFNGLSYNFLSNCSYLLASDFKTRLFSLVVNYENTSGVFRKSYEIISNDSSFEIFDANHVELNGKKTDLPIVYKQVTIIREKENIIAESSRGFKMICYFHYDYCTVQLSGWLFGKTAGLLGTLDNEQYTDITTAQKTTTEVVHFLKSWQLQKNQECQLILSPNNQPGDHDYIAQICDLWFGESTSPLQKCFQAVDPKMYAQMCYNELRANPEVKVCAPAAAYVHRCRQARVLIEMPELCVMCKDDIGYQEEIFDGNNNKTVDVVFITELGCTNSSQVTKTLPELLNRALIQKQFVGNRFASVAYGGGVLPKPHVHTHDGAVWSQAGGLQIESRIPATNLTKSKFTGIDAIKYASNLEYRVGVSKVFILVQCEVSADIGNSPDIYNMLGEKDITLHALKPNPFGKKSPLLGIDLGTTVPTRDISVNQVINQIDDVYGGLALSTNGTIFDLRAVLASDSSAQLWASNLVRHVHASPCQRCKCVQDFNGVGKIECSRCLAPAVKQFLNEYEESTKMQFSDN